MTPLEIAKANLLREEEEKKHPKPPCKDCPKSERVKELLFCSVTGKIILPQHEHICICRGKRFEESEDEG